MQVDWVCNLVGQVWYQVAILQELQYNAVTKAKASAWSSLAPKCAQQLIIAATPKQGSKLLSTITALKNNPCIHMILRLVMVVDW